MTEKKKEVTLLNLTANGIGSVVGAGIFVMMGFGIAYTGHAVSLALVFGMLVMLFATAYSIYLSSMFKLDGGLYSQQALLCPPIIAGVSALNYFISSLGLAVFGVAMVNYVGTIIPAITPYTKIIAISIETIFFLSSIKGMKFMAVIQSFMAIILSISLTIFIVVGLTKVQNGYFNNFFMNGESGFLSAIGILSFACLGGIAPVSMTAEAKNPKKNVPKSILLTTLAVAVIYGLMGIVSSGILPIEQTAGQPVSIVAKGIFSPAIFIILILGGAVFAIATTLYGMIISLKYPILAAVDDGWLPKVLGKKTQKNEFPYVLMAVMYIIAIIPIIFDIPIDTLASWIIIPTIVIYTLCNIMVLGIPKKYPQQWKESILRTPFPVFVIIIVIGIVCDIFIIFQLFNIQSTVDKLISAGITLLLFIYSFVRMKTGHVNIKSIQDTKNSIAEQAVKNGATEA